MAKACSYAPRKGTQTFYKLKNELGYEKAWKVFGIAMNPKFQQDFGDTLSLDAEGVPTYSSIMQNRYIQKYIGDKTVIDMLQREYRPKEDTMDNYNDCLEDANKFNTTHPNRDRFTALVDYADDQITVSIVNKSEKSDKIFQNQYQSQQLNKRLADILSPLGITIGMLTQEETDAGRVGVTDFSKARRIATDTISMIRIADNREGAEALSEEFSHLIIGALRDKPIVSRTINMLSTDEQALREILGNEYEDTVGFQGDMTMVAEEALGKLLQKNLKLQNETKSTTLLNRFINFVKSLFKRISMDRVQSAISDADGAMSSLAKDILSGKTELKKEDIAASQRDAQFNALSDRIQRNIDILTKAKEVELKRYKISDNADAKDIYARRAARLDGFDRGDRDTVEGILNYAQQAVSELRQASNSLRNIQTMFPADMFRTLRGIRSTIQSYGSFINYMNDAINEESDEEDNMFLKKFFAIEVNGNSQEVDVSEVVKELNNLMGQVSKKLMKVSKDKFAGFLKPFLGEEIVIQMGKHKGEKVSVRELLDTAESDISFMDRWLDAMGDSSDILLQAFDAIVKKANDTARYNTIESIREIQALRRKAESYGIRSFDWMFEKDRNGKKTGNYIGEINYSQFEQDYQELMNKLNEKYGRNAKGEQARLKLNERDEWLKTHAVESMFGDIDPNPTVYRNKDFDRLTPKQLEIREEFLKIKQGLDKKLPSDRVANLKAVQMRKDGIQRFIDSASNPSQIWSNIKEHLGSELLEREDDDTIFGDTSIKRGLTDFAGQEFMVLPVLYTNRLFKPEELSTDIFGTLMAYSAMSNRYEQMDKIIDPLEVGRSIITDGGRKVKRTRGGNKLVEKFSALGERVMGDTYEPSGTNIEKRLQDFFECQVYQRYLKDQGTWDIFGKKVNVNKLVSKALSKSSTAQLGFNFLANIANVTTGVAMQNIEAAAGEFFSAKELARADATYLAAMKDYVGEIGSRDKKSKLALVDEYFNIKGEFNKHMKFSDQRRSWLKRVFGSSVLFLGQECGDHWLYNRTAIAMMLREKVNVPGKGQTSLWDALEVKVEDGIGRLALPEGTTSADGKSISIGSNEMTKFSRKMLHVNQSLFGIYNDEDANAANRVAVGRLIMQYRKWMKAQYNKRFMAGQQSLAVEQWEEGYYRTMFRFTNELIRGKFQVASQWKQMSPHERANIRRALTDMAQTFAIWCIANLVEWPDDKNRPWAMKLAEYSSKRLTHELGNLTPSTIMVNEMLKTVKSPAASLSLIGDLTKLVGSSIDPRDWTNEIQSGPYKGMSTWEKNLLKAPIPGVTQYRQVNKFIGGIDTSLQYYARPQ